jgi:predicted nucleic acid-binding protein
MSAEPAHFVLDSFALLAFLEGEAGMARVKEILTDAEKGRCAVYLSWINLGEVLYITEREQGEQKAREVLGHIQVLPIQMLEVPSKLVINAAHIKANHRMSYADAFAVASALETGSTLLTADPEFASVESFVQVEWLAK